MVLGPQPEVTKVYKFIEYYPSKCFEKFGLNVSEARHAGDSDPSKAVLAESQKLHGNSSYGKCLTNKEKHREVHYCNRSEVTKLINSRVFHRLNIITDDLHEVECLKKSVKEDLPIQISFFVYGYTAKPSSKCSNFTSISCCISSTDKISSASNQTRTVSTWLSAAEHSQTV